VAVKHEIRLNKSTPLPWLIGQDTDNPGVRYFALRDLLELPESDAEVREARSTIMRSDPVPAILEAQQPDRAWVKNGSGYSPEYRATVWSLLILVELGADPDEPRVRRSWTRYPICGNAE
jgi:hypothetical protein